MDKGVMSPAELMRMASWPHDPDELAPFVTEVTEEAARAREAITPRIRSDDVFWDGFRRRYADLAEVRWPRVWEHVYDGIARERAAEAEARRRAAPPKSALERALDMNDRLSRVQQQPAFLPVPRPETDFGAIAARRSDQLKANHARAQQQVEDLARVSDDHGFLMVGPVAGSVSFPW